MELPPWASSFHAAVIILTATATLLLWRAHRPRYRLPPGPRQWPVIGNLHLMGALPHRSIRDLSACYGPLMQLRFGPFPVVVGSSPETARLLLQTHDAALAGRPRTAAGRHTAYDHSDMLLSPYGAHWRRLRRVCLSELFSAARLASYEHIRQDEVRALLRGLHAAATSCPRGGAVVVVKEHLFTATLGMISRMVLGRKYVKVGSPSASGMTPEQFTQTMDEFFFLNGALNVGDFVPWLDRLDLQGYVARMKRVGATLDSFMERVLDEHAERRQLDWEGFAASDMVDVLLELAEGDRLERDSVKGPNSGSNRGGYKH
ncbi:hypothetical protein ACQ4PT_070708 [Festuca glaucescens]